MKLFTPEDRARVRERLLDLARSDDRIVGAALTGSAARDDEDRWSDVDVFLGVSEGIDITDVLDEWTQLLYAELGALHHWDVVSGAAVYRVFLLANCLQVDVAFAPESSFGARGTSFRALFGNPIDTPMPSPTFGEVAGLGWLGILHANAAIRRGQPLKAEYWISSARDQTLSLACLRHGESPAHALGIDRLPETVTAPLDDALVRSLALDELRRALAVAMRCLVQEIRRADAQLADRLEGPLRALTGG